MTEKLYHYDSYQTTFKATILNQYPEQGRFALILDRTHFYPSSGGQICDRGTIEGIPVINVQEANGKIIHYLKKELSAGIGDTINGEIDWKYRFDHMQQHSGQHILSAALIDLWQKETQSFHMGEDTCTIDILSMPLDYYKMKELEEMVNRIIYENRPIHHYYAEDNGETDNKKLRKLQKIHEKLRIIEIEKFDLNACGGTHCHHTGEIGIIKITGWENLKDKIRISFLCGHRALVDYQKKHLLTKNLSHMLTTGIDQLEEKIAKMDQEKKDLNKQYSRMEKSLLRFEAEELKATNGMTQRDLLIVSKIFLEKLPESLQQIAFMLINQNNCVAILGTEKPEPVLCLGRSRDHSLQVGALVKKIIIEYNGKGGGSDFMAMVKFEKVEELRNAFKRITELILLSE